VTRINQTGGQQVNEGDLLFVIKPMLTATSA
jgi:multidrug resistance efflux pump